MLAVADMSFCVKNTFIDVEDTQKSGDSRRRPSSMPPAVGRVRREEGGDEAAAEQLVRLDAIARGDDKVRRLPAASPASDVSTAPSPAMGGWSSFDSAEASPAAAAGAPALSYPSVGSAGHADRTCRPCAFARSSAGCKFGAECNFCHLVAEHMEQVRMRPCKGKRERFKRTMAAIEGKVAENPDLITNGGLSLPAFVDRNPQARARMMAQLAQVAADAYRGAGLGSS